MYKQQLSSTSSTTTTTKSMSSSKTSSVSTFTTTIITNSDSTSSDFNSLPTDITEKPAESVIAGSNRELVSDGKYKEMEFRVYEYHGPSVDKGFLRKRGQYLCQSAPEKFHLLMHSDQVVGAFSGDATGVHCGQLLQEILVKIGGKGGGSKCFAEGRLSKNLDECKQKIKKLLCR